LSGRSGSSPTGLGGYASGTLSGALTRRFHAYLVAALPAPFGRTVMLNYIWETSAVIPDGRVVSLHNVIDTPAGKEFEPRVWLVSFRLEGGAAGLDLRRRRSANREASLDGAHAEHHAHSYHLLSTKPVRLELRPLVAFRLHEAPVNHPGRGAVRRECARRSLRAGAGWRPAALRMFLYGRGEGVHHHARIVRERDLCPRAQSRIRVLRKLWTPGYFRFQLKPDAPGTLVASTESWETVSAVDPVWLPQAEEHRRRRLVANARPPDGFAGELMLAAESVRDHPCGPRRGIGPRPRQGDEVRTVIAGYHWFTDWGRDTMISLEGLTLCTARQRERATSCARSDTTSATG